MTAEPEHHLGTALRWLLGWGAPCTVAPFALAAWGAHLSNPMVVVLMFALIAWLILYARVAAARSRRAAAVASETAT